MWDRSTRASGRERENIFTAKGQYFQGAGKAIRRCRGSWFCSTGIFLRVNLKIISAIMEHTGIKMGMFMMAIGKMM